MSPSAPIPAVRPFEALVIEGYRAGALTHRNIYEHVYDVEDRDRDLATLRSIEAKSATPSDR
jgi:hypothetical protein